MFSFPKSILQCIHVFNYDLFHFVNIPFTQLHIERHPPLTSKDMTMLFKWPV